MAAGSGNALIRTPLIIFASLVFASAAFADNESELRASSDTSGIRYSDEYGNAEAPRVYIVQLRTPAVAEQQAAMQANFVSTKPGQRQSFNKNNPSSQQYAQQISLEQERVLGKAGGGVRKIYSYRYSLNGFAAAMTPAQAHKLEHLAEVKAVWEDEIRPLQTNYSPEFLGLFESGVGLRGALGLDGENIIIGVIDSGITPEHPSLTDTVKADAPQLCQSNWAASSILGKWLCARYNRADDKVVFEPPENWLGSCEAGEQFLETDCNNKLIGARYFNTGALETGIIDSGEFLSARDAAGHGTHTATIAAGNRVSASSYGTYLGRIEGMAPRARVAAYKACWVRPGDIRASCNTSDLTQAIDAAVGDGVDIINFSVGNSLSTVITADDVALMAAAKAGIFTAVSAGNDGPNLTTIGSPAGSPWVMTVAASSRDGQHSLEAMQVSAPPSVAGKYAVREANFTPPLQDRDPIEGSLILVDDNDVTFDNGASGSRMDACEPLVNGNEVSGQIALIERGGCLFETKIGHAEDAGAIAVVVFNIAGDPIVMTGNGAFIDIPALMIGQADGNLLVSEIDANNTVDVVLDKGFFLTKNETGNIMGSFSSRGPGPVKDILKPDVTAPGINILAGFSPDTANSVSGESFAYQSGTSMAAPHVAGVAALLLEAHPEWSPATIKSALMTTAYQDVFQPDGENDAIPFDFGSGHIKPNLATDPGLVFDAGADDYDAFACGVESTGVDAARCDQLVAAGWSLQAADFNLPSISLSRLANNRSVTRRVSNPGNTAETYTANVVAPAGVNVAVTPSTLSVAPGQTESFDVTFTYGGGAMNYWQFGSLTWQSENHSVYMPIATRPVALTAPEELKSFGGSGTLSFPVEFGYSGNYTAGIHGLRKPLVVNGFVDQDPDRTFTFRNTNGVTAHLIDVPANQLYMRFALFDEFTDGNDDLDLYVYYCADNVNCVKIGESGELTSNEEFSQALPSAGRYAVLVHGFEADPVAGGPGANYQLFGWAFGLIDNRGNMTVDAPSLVGAGATETVTVNWTTLEADSIYLGGISHNTPMGLAGLTVIQIRN